MASAATATATATATTTTPTPPPAKKPSQPPSTTTTPATWSHAETLHLIDAYQEKWYSLNRGQLKAHQWEDVAASVAARSSSNPPSKTATQCRHKMEKLRKRYRSDKHRPSSPWPFFHRMDLLERGPITDDHHEDDDDLPPSSSTATRSLHHILRRRLPLLDKPFPRFSRSPRFRKRSFDASYHHLNHDNDIDTNNLGSYHNDNDNDNDDRDDDLISELASVVRSFGEGFVRIEKMKMDMMRDVERSRMEMEMKRTEMILKSQQRIADALSRAFAASPHNKPNNSHDIAN